MAADGSIVISTKIDDRDAQKELNRLKKQIDSLEESIKQNDAQRSPLVQQAEELRSQMKAATAEVEKYKAQWVSGVSGADRDETIARDNLIQLQSQYDAIVQKIDKYDAAIQKADIALEQNKNRAGELTRQLSIASNSSEKYAAATEKARKSMDNFGKRISNTLKSALIFSVMYKGLSLFRDYMGKALKTSAEFTSALAALKANALTAFQPIITTIIPVLTTLVNLLSAATNALARFFSFLSGKSLSSTAEAAEAMYDEANAIGATGGAAKDAEKSLASFDEVNQLSGSSGGGGGGSATGIEPDFTALEETNSRMKEILGLVLDIGAALLAWKIARKFGRSLKESLGIALAVGGAIEFISEFIEAWNEGINVENLLSMLGSLALVVAGLGLAFGSTGAAIGLIVGGMALLVIGFKDAFENGWNLENLIASVAGIFAAGMGISILTGSWIPALIGGIAGILLAITVLTGHGGELLDGLRLMFQGFLDFFGGIFTGDFQRAADGLTDIFDGLGAVFGSIIDGVKDGLNLFLDWLNEKTHGAFASDIQFLKDTFSSILDGVKEVLGGVIDFITGVFTGDWDKAWGGIKRVFTGIWDGIVGALEAAVNLVVRGVNWLIDQLNTVSFDVPEWVPLIGGKKWGFNISHVSEVTLPRIGDAAPGLATGAVIPPNREFLARLGDQKSGYNIEAPESLIRRIVREESGGSGGNQTIIMEVDGQQFAKIVYKYGNRESRRIGVSLVET